jgi:hypothetical protein
VSFPRPPGFILHNQRLCGTTIFLSSTLERRGAPHWLVDV